MLGTQTCIVHAEHHGVVDLVLGRHREQHASGTGREMLRRLLSNPLALTGAVTHRVLRPDSTATDPGQMRAALLASVRASMRRKRMGSPAGPAGEADISR